MRHTHQHAKTWARERRDRVAQEAARMMAESGIGDVNQARRKAASRLGIDDDASLPRNDEIENALRTYQRLFSGDAHDVALRVRRDAALQALDFFAPFTPRLVGAVLDGTADANAPVQLHLHSDEADAVTRFLDDHGIPAELRDCSLRLDRNRSVGCPVWRFNADGLVFELTVLPQNTLRQAPLSAEDATPMRRASLAQLRALRAAEANNERGEGGGPI